jgi:hypothetical protein
VKGSRYGSRCEDGMSRRLPAQPARGQNSLSKAESEGDVETAFTKPSRTSRHVRDGSTKRSLRTSSSCEIGQSSHGGASMETARA